MLSSSKFQSPSTTCAGPFSALGKIRRNDAHSDVTGVGPWGMCLPITSTKLKSAGQSIAPVEAARLTMLNAKSRRYCSRSTGLIPLISARTALNRASVHSSNCVIIATILQGLHHQRQQVGLAGLLHRGELPG